MADNDKVTIDVGGMSCQHCVAAVKEKLASFPGVSSVEVSLTPGQAVVVGQNLNPAALRSAIEELGFDAN